MGLQVGESELHEAILYPPGVEAKRCLPRAAKDAEMPANRDGRRVDDGHRERLAAS